MPLMELLLIFDDEELFQRYAITLLLAGIDLRMFWTQF